MTGNRTNLDMTVGNPSILIWSFSIPLIAGNLFQQLYSLIDASIVGRFIGVPGFAAVTCTSWVIWMINAVVRDLSNTFSILASVCVGKRKPEEYKKTAITAYLSSEIVAIAAVMAILLSTDQILQALNVSAEIYSEAKIYLTIIALAMPIGTLFHITVALMRAVGNSTVTFRAMICSTVANILLDLLLIIVLPLGVAGAAMATLLSQLVSLAVALFEAKKEETLRFDWADLHIDMSILKSAAKLWAPMLINSSIISIGGLYVQGATNGVGTAFTAGVEASGTVFSMMEAVIMAVQTGLSVFVGQNMGANKPNRVQNGVHQTVISGLALTMFMGMIMWALSNSIYSFLLMEENTEMLELAIRTAVNATKVTLLGMLIMTPMYYYRATLQTMGHPNYIALAGFLQMVMRITTLKILPKYLGEYAYYLPNVVAWIITLPIVCIPFYRYIGQLIRDQRGVN